MHSILPFLIALIASIVILTMIANKLKIAYPIVLVLAGLCVGFIRGLPEVNVNPDLIFFIFLPPLLFEAAWSVSFKEMRKWWRIITSFAFLVVFFTAFTVALVTHNLIPGFTLALGFLLGGIVSPPDAVSTAAITKFVKIPRTTSTVLEGESLLNDASSLIIFRFAVIAVTTGVFEWRTATISFLWMVFGGVGIGIALAALIVFLQKRLPTDAPSDIVFTILTPYFLYWLTETAHSSGVLAVVAGGLFMADKRLLFLNSKSRVHGYSVWESFVFVLNGLVFLLIGLQLPVIVDGLHKKGIPFSTAIWYGVIVTITLIVVRIISSYLSVIATYLFRRSVLPRFISPAQALKLPLVFGWTGMRGVVSLAAALAIPATVENNTEFPFRDLILFITFMVILLTLVIQGLTLPGIIRRSRLSETTSEPSDEEELLKLRSGLMRHSQEFLQQKLNGEWRGHAGLQKLLGHWKEKTKSENSNWLNNDNKELYLQLLESQRKYLDEVNRSSDTPEELLRKQLYLIDLEEERIRES